jgi:hypothetical protein
VEVLCLYSHFQESPCTEVCNADYILHEDSLIAIKRGDAMLDTLPFLQDPKRFLQSYFWGCNVGYELSLTCKLQIEQAAAVALTAGEGTRFLAEERFRESLVDCYVHTKVCRRCQSIENVTCKSGYQLLKERDAALDESFRVVATEETKSDSEEFNSLVRLVPPAFKRHAAQQKFLDHIESCAKCSLKPPRGRYSIAAWNIEVARSQKLG